jgi:hypothetical protein
MDKILEDVVFQYCGIEKFPIGQSVGNEWDEMDSILRVRFALYTYNDDDKTIYFSNLFVDEKYRNNGYANKILEWVFK